jgi:hypothetical protein
MKKVFTIEEVYSKLLDAKKRLSGYNHVDLFCKYIIEEFEKEKFNDIEKRNS